MPTSMSMVSLCQVCESLWLYWGELSIREWGLVMGRQLQDPSYFNCSSILPLPWKK